MRTERTGDRLTVVLDRPHRHNAISRRLRDELAAALAIALADRSIEALGLPEIGIGLVPGAGGTVSLTRRIGRQCTAVLGLTMRHLDATTALDWHLVDEIVAADT